MATSSLSVQELVDAMTFPRKVIAPPSEEFSFEFSSEVKTRLQRYWQVKKGRMTAYTLQGPFDITFRYYRESDKTPYATECFLTDKQGEAVAMGAADCHSGDPFDKEKGRKIALKRAIKNFSRTDRREFWRAYFDRLSVG